MESEEYDKRTERNILDTDGIFIASHGPLTGGSLLTQILTVRYNRPCLHIDFAKQPKSKSCAELKNRLVINDIRILNVAAPRKSSSPDFSSVQAVSGSKFLAMNYSNLCSLPKY